jgi:hypothetical protein
MLALFCCILAALALAFKPIRREYVDHFVVLGELQIRVHHI